MEDINNINDNIKVAKKKSTIKKTSKESKTEQKEKNVFHKKYNNIFVQLNRLKRWRYQKKSKYYKTPTDLPLDIIMLINNKYSTIKDIENLYSTLIQTRCLSVIKNRFKDIIELENNNNQNLNQNDNQNIDENIDENIDDINNIVDEIDNIIRETDKKIIDIILNILREIKNKFEIISEKIIYVTLSSTHYYNDVSSDIVKFFKDNGYKIKTKKIFINLLNFFNQNFLDIIDFDKINIDDEILEKILLSYCMYNTNYENIEKIYNILNNNNNVNFFDILIKIILNYEFYRYQGTQQKVFNIFNFVIKINPSKCLEILQHIPFIVFADNYFDDDFNLYDDNFDIKNIINKIKNNINTTFNIYIDKLDKLDKLDNISKFNNIYDIKTYGNIDDKILKELFNLIHPYFIDNTQNKKNKRRRMQKKIIVIKNDNIYYDFIDEHTYNFFGKQITGSEIKEIYNIIRKIFYNYICDKFTKEKDIIKITDCSIFKYNNFLLNNEEKINLFKNIFNGKILANDITSFIINNNEIADFLITKSKLNENLIKTAFKISNYNFINRMIELKYNMKTSYLKYINQDNYLIDILKIINKYNTLEFDDEIDWALHIKYLNPNINISEYIYDENNEELRKQLNEKINKYLELSIIDKFNLMNFDEFIGYVNSNKIKININDLIKINDYRKRVILLDHIKM